ncbi:hypothetical protein ACVWZA_003906 [Sphingomonas sp. UYAg733]
MAQAMLSIAILYDVGFAVFHLLFWRLFVWPTKLEPSGRLNTAITQTLNVMLIYVFAAYAGTLFALPAGDERAIALFLGAGFWALRAAVQPLLFSTRGKTGAMMTGLFAIGAITHTLAAFATAIGTSGR